MNGWLERPGYAVALAFVGGVAVAVIVFVIVLQLRDGDDGPSAVTGTATSTAAATGTPPPGTPSVTGTAGPQTTATPPSGPFTRADDALAAFVQRELGQTYLGPCPQTPDGVPQGLCSVDLYRSDNLVTAGVGPPFSEIIGEAVLTRSDDGSWEIEFLLAPQGAISVGIEVMVYGAGDCLNFREEPRASGKVLSCQIDGATGRVAEGPVEADGITWWRLQDLGWASAQYLGPSSR